jgi:hypothetical protein
VVPHTAVFCFLLSLVFLGVLLFYFLGKFFRGSKMSSVEVRGVCGSCAFLLFVVIVCLVAMAFSVHSEMLELMGIAR